MERFQAFSRLTLSGMPAASATVTVRLAGTATLANLFNSNSTADPKANPFTAGTDGLAQFYAANSRYDVTFSGGGITTPWSLGDVLLFDPNDVTSGAPINVKESPYNARGDGLTDDTAAFVAAFATGRTIYIPAGSYLTNNLTLAAAGQVVFGDGKASSILIKNANGPHLTLTNRDIQLRDFSVRGESSAPVFTGDELVISGASVADIQLVRLDVRWTLGQALNAGTSAPGALLIEGGGYSHSGLVGDPVMTLGHVGLAANDLLYVTIVGVVTHQADQPIRLICASGCSISGSQIGGLQIRNSTTGASTVNKVIGNRIIGDIQILGASHVFTGNAVAPGKTVLFDVDGVSSANGCVWVGNVEGNTTVITNNANINNLIIRNQATSVAGVRFGGTTSLANLNYDVATGDWSLPGNLTLPNAKAYKQLRASGASALSVANLNASDNLFLGQTTVGTFTQVSAPASVNAEVGGVTKTNTGTDYFRPATDNVINLGGGSNRWKEVFAGNGTINTSDERDKLDVAPPSDALLDAWAEVEYTQYRWKDAVEAKGEAARLHVGVVAQRIAAVFLAHGLDAARYGLFTYDRWDAHDVLDGTDTAEDGTVTERWRHVPAGDRFGVRYTECLALEAALQRRTTQRLAARLAQLESPEAPREATAPRPDR